MFLLRSIIFLLVICRLVSASDLIYEDTYREEAKWHFDTVLKILSDKTKVKQDTKEAIRILHEIIDCYDSQHMEAYVLLIKLYKEEGDTKNLKKTEDRYKIVAEMDRKQKEQEAKEIYSPKQNINEQIIKLGSSEFGVRKKAVSELLNFGKDAEDGLINALNSTNIYRSCLSAGILGRIKSSKTVIALSVALNSGTPSLKIKAIESLGNINDTASIPVLINALSDDYFNHYSGIYEVREKASNVLAEVFKEKSLSYLFEAVKNPSLRNFSILTILKYNPLPKGTEEILLQALSDNNEEVRLTALNGLSSSIDINKIYDSIVKLIKDKNFRIRLEAVRLLSHSKEERVLHLLISAISDTDISVVNEAIKHIGSFKLDKISKLLLEIAEDANRDVTVRWYAIKSLGENFKQNDKAKIKELMQDKNMYIRTAAAAALDIDNMVSGNITKELLKMRRENLDTFALMLSSTSAKAFEEARQASVRKALEYIVSQQEEDGHFKSKYFPLGTTQLALICLLKEGWSEDSIVIKKGIEYMLKFEQKDGAYTSSSDVKIGNNVEKNKTSYNTALAIMVLAGTKNNKYSDKTKKSIEFMKSIQDEQGGFGYFKNSRSDMSSTEYAIMGLDKGYEFLGLEKNDELWIKLMKYIQKQQNKDGGFGYSHDWERHSYGSMTAAGLICQMLTNMPLSSEQVNGSLKWLSDNYTLETNPKADSDKHHPDYLKSFAIGMNLTGLNSITDSKGNVHYLFEEIVNKLLKEQKPDGKWEVKYYEPILSTEFFLMIMQLKKLEKTVIDLF
jgi:HEAT repeat protein